jgi:hypothetical protein
LYLDSDRLTLARHRTVDLRQRRGCDRFTLERSEPVFNSAAELALDGGANRVEVNRHCTILARGHNCGIGRWQHEIHGRDELAELDIQSTME